MKKIFLLLSLLFLAGCSFNNPPFGAVEKTLQEKYNLSEVKNKYQLDGKTLKRVVKDNPKDIVRVEIGEQALGGLGGSQDLEPKLTIGRWDEVQFSIKPKNYDKVLLKNKKVKFEGNKTIFETPKENYFLYEMATSTDLPEGAFEYQIDLKKKPATNVIEFTLETQGLDFFYQPELTQKEKDEGANRPENVVGSFAVYASEQKINCVGCKEYKVGKIGHIYRPLIIDSAGTEVWGTLKIDKIAGILSIEISQSFLNTAVYPIKHAAGLTFGYTTVGGTSGVFAAGNDAAQMAGQYTATTGDTITSYSIYMATNAIVQSFAAYTVVEGVPSSRLAAGVSLTTNSATAQWWTTGAVSQAMANGSVYCTGFDFIGSNRTLYFDEGSAPGRHLSNHNTLPATWAGATTDSGRHYSIYATYTAAGGGTAAATPDDNFNISDE